MKDETPKLIWIDDIYKKDCYVEFISSFSSKDKKGYIDIGVDTDYELYINGEFVNSGAYLTYPGKLYLDTLKLSLKESNTLKIIVFYNGANSFATYYQKNPCLYFKIYTDDSVLCVSNEKVQSRYDSNYLSFNEKFITLQLGYKVFYNFIDSNKTYHNSIVVNQDIQLLKRPNKKLSFLEFADAKLIKKDCKSQIFDIGKETVGYLSISIFSNCERDINISFGEHIEEGKILDLIGGRDFRFNLHLKEGKNERVFYLRRIGCRYLSIDDCSGLNIEKLGIVPVEYPFIEKDIKTLDKEDQKLLDVAKYTLKCCYHEHFEDCPWREQAQYTFDMKCSLIGYFKIFENKEAVDSAIELIVDDPRSDGDLDITFPSHFPIIIPSFTLHFVSLMYEYYIATNNKELLSKSLSKIELIITSYIKKINNDLLSVKKSPSCWVFYEWKPGFDGNGDIVPEKDFLLNVIFLHALQLAKTIYQVLKVEFKYSKYIDLLKENIVKEFYIPNKKTFIFSKENQITSELMLGYAILTNLIPEQNKEFASQIVNKQVNESTNSFKSIVYESLLSVDLYFKSYIIDEIHKIYGKMINDGATTFYETNLGYLDFGKAGSLCHAWNAFIIKYLLELER